MICEHLAEALPAYVGGDADAATAREVERHLAGCARCRRDAAALERVRAGLAVLRERELEPPPYLLESLLEGVRTARARRFLPLPPLPPQDLIRVLQDNREALLSAAGTALVVGGTVYALWRAVRGVRAHPEPAR